MKQGNPIADRFREVVLNGKWVANTNFKKALEGVTWQQANRKIGSLNTIAALTFHVNYYIAGILKVFEGGALEIRDKYSFDCPEIESQEDWERLVGALLENAEKFAKHLDGMSEEALDRPFVEKKYGDFRRNIQGIIEHNYYHLGQISLLKKLISETDSFS